MKHVCLAFLPIVLMVSAAPIRNDSFRGEFVGEIVSIHELDGVLTSKSAPALMLWLALQAITLLKRQRI